MNVLVTGTLGYDYIMNFQGLFAERIMPERIHKLSLSFLVETLNKQRGGTAGNIAYSLNLLGNTSTIISSAGNDFSPYLKALKVLHMNTNGITIHKDVATSSYFVVTDKDDNQIGSFFIGASSYNTDISLSNYISAKTAGRSFAIIAPNVPSAMKKYVSQCEALKIPFMYDPAFQIGSIEPEVLLHGVKGASIVIANDYEIGLMQDRLGISHEELILHSGILITTIGSRGSIIETRKDAIHIKPAKAKNAIDPTGAGDAYRAGFMTGYLKNFDLATCGQMGSVASVYTVEAYGTQTHTFSINDFCSRYSENFQQTLHLSTPSVKK